jgi:pyrroline-5-carboxylate reductase
MFGGGPAYFLYIINCFKEISKRSKIKEKDSINLLLKLLEGTTEVLKKYPKDLDLLIKKVTSKGGTTEEAMKVLKNKKIIFNRFDMALKNATKKSILLAKKY